MTNTIILKETYILLAWPSRMNMCDSMTREYMYSYVFIFSQMFWPFIFFSLLFFKLFFVNELFPIDRVNSNSISTYLT
jgi:hypothetical protein